MHIPSSTYRVQLNQDFTLEELKKIIPYLADLGISTIYAAPLVKAAPGSMHGYDVTDPHRINPEVGNFKQLKEINQLLLDKGMQWLQDIVPNHMAFSTHNVRLMDVLERGSVSPYYRYFDINWNHHNPVLKGKVMVPFLGKDLNEAIHTGEVRLSFSEHGLTLKYYDDHYPLSYHAYTFLQNKLNENQYDLRVELNHYEKHLQKKLSLSEWISYKKEWISFVRKNNLEKQLIQLCERVNHEQSSLKYIVRNQFYLLCHWKLTESEINYRRFFTINSLICLSMEREDVFDEYHQLISNLYKEGIIHGVRIDHIDGLNDPPKYLERLRNLLGPECYIIAEKILESEEKIPSTWQIQGTSGYEFLSFVNKLLTDRHGASELVSFYETLVPAIESYEELVLKNKKLILERHMAGELDNLVENLNELDLLGNFSQDRMKSALKSLMLSLPVYRIYPDHLPLTGDNNILLGDAFKKANMLNDHNVEELNYLYSLCFEKQRDRKTEETIILFLKRLMQFTGPLTAKGVEDTTFYLYNPLISHDEVGDTPSSLGTAIQYFHKRMITRMESNPLSLNATATHDTKRGEDARLRLNALSEIPQLWTEHVRSWIETNKGLKQIVNEELAPDLNDEYFIYQSILGGFPEDFRIDPGWIERTKEYLIKVVREGKIHSHWENPNTAYEDACAHFVEGLLKEDSDFYRSFLPFAKQVVEISSISSLAQTVVKITAPGIPDIYQGCELWDLSYVDPDNRRPVDFDLRSDFLQKIKAASESGWEAVVSLLHQHQDAGIEKLFVTFKALNYRKKNHELFEYGVYVPLTLLGEGTLAIGYARYLQEKWCIVVIPFPLPGKNTGVHAEIKQNVISLPANSPTKWRNIFTDERLDVRDGSLGTEELFLNFPVAVLSNDLLT
jgi:(1->4)-alpha-D-glucan 1-alpha-D-glucosylmutase